MLNIKKMITSPSHKLHKLVFALDHEANKMLQKRFGISHKRAVFLAVLRSTGPVTQHSLAKTLGHSDPGVSSMLSELKKDGHIMVSPDPEHGRKHIVQLTESGDMLAYTVNKFLDKKFDMLSKAADVDTDLLSKMADDLYNTLVDKK